MCICCASANVQVCEHVHAPAHINRNICIGAHFPLVWSQDQTQVRHLVASALTCQALSPALEPVFYDLFLI